MYIWLRRIVRRRILTKYLLRIARLNDQVARLTSKCELQTMQLKEKDVTIQVMFMGSTLFTVV